MKIEIETAYDDAETLEIAADLLFKLAAKAKADDNEGIADAHEQVKEQIQKLAEPEIPPAPRAPAPTVPLPPNAPLPNVHALAPPPNMGANVDSAGVLYDPRLHASSRAKNKDGTWRTRRNSDITKITPASAAPAGQITTTVPPPPVDLPGAPDDDEIEVDIDDPEPTPGGSETVLQGAEPISVDQFFSKITSAATAGRVTQQKIMEVCAMFGLSNYAQVYEKNDPRIMAAMLAQLGL